MTPLCVDNFGSNVYRCHWTGVLVLAQDALLIGGFYPGVRAVYISAPDYASARKKQSQLFHESERNCNTCRHLVRSAHARSPFGWLFGRCASTPINLPYALRDSGEMMFHPDDPMHMNCWEAR